MGRKKEEVSHIFNNKGKLVANTAKNRNAIKLQIEKIKLREAESVRNIREDLPNNEPVATTRKTRDERRAGFKGFTYTVSYFELMNDTQYSHLSSNASQRSKIINHNGAHYYRFSTYIAVHFSTAQPEGYYEAEIHGEKKSGVYIRKGKELIISNEKLRNNLKNTYPDIIQLSNKQTPRTNERRNDVELQNNSLQNKTISKYMINERVKNSQSFKIKCPIPTILPNGCWYNTIIENFSNEKFKKRYNYDLTIERLRDIFEARGDENGVSIEQATKFFIKYCLFLIIYDYKMNIIKEYRPITENHHLSGRGIRCIVHNKHTYLLNKNVKSIIKKDCITYDIDINLMSERINLVNEKKIIELPTILKINSHSFNTFEDCYTELLVILNVITENTHIYYIGDMTELLIRLMYDENVGLTPNILGVENKIRNISFFIDLIEEEQEAKEINVNITSLDGIKGDATELMNLTTENLNIYLGHKKKLDLLLKTRKYVSYFSNSLLEAFKINRFPPLIKSLVNINEKLNYDCIDINKSYPNILCNVMVRIPIFTVFDEFEDYDDEFIVPTYFYIVFIDGEKMSEIDRLFLFDRYRENCDDLLAGGIQSDEYMLSGYDIEALSIYNLPFKIIRFISCFKSVENPVMYVIKEILNDENQAKILRKFVCNSFIGEIGKRINKKSESIISKNLNDIDDFEVSNIGTEKEPIYYGVKTYEKDLINGFYHIQNMIYSHQRVLLYNLYKLLHKEGIKSYAIRVDCIYICYNNLTEIQKEFIKGILSNEIGGYKLEKDKKLK